MATNIQVAVRVRQFLPFEAGSKSCIDVLPGEDEAPSSSPLSQGKTISIRTHGHGHAPKNGHTFTFDRCFSGLAGQVEIYRALVVPLLKSCLEGYNATTVAYGQTGAGKTYTTLGPATSPDFFAPQNADKQSQEYDAVGLLPRALRDLFNQLDQKHKLLNNGEDEKENASLGENQSINGHVSANGLAIPETKSPPSPKQRRNNTINKKSSKKQPFEYQVKLQFLELYGEDVRDLLTTPDSKVKITIRDTGGDAEALGATAVPVATAQEAMVCLTRGMLRRVTGATSMNAESSRSHAIMCVMIEQITRSDTEGEGEAVVVNKSKFNFVDLAGSERQKRTNAKGQRDRKSVV